jgi:hypothetical protein
MADAVREYAQHRGAPDSWALGRFVVPLGRWEELLAELGVVDQAEFSWPVSLLSQPTEVEAVRRVMASDDRLVVEAIELRASSPDEAGMAASLSSTGVDVFVEPASLTSFDAIAPVLSHEGASAKIRTGGVTTAAFPTSAQVISFLGSCLRHGLRFKATAGLHHAVRGEYRLTYEPAPPTGEMFGFLNVGVAAALTWFDRGEHLALTALEERSPDAFEFSEAGLAWRDEHLTTQQLDEVRAEFFVGFGSCSFREPMAELGFEALPRS